jgi:hypothetical protein
MIHVGVGLGIDETVVTTVVDNVDDRVTTLVLVVVGVPPLHIYESPGTYTQVPTQSPDVLQQDPSGAFFLFLP